MTLIWWTNENCFNRKSINKTQTKHYADTRNKIIDPLWHVCQTPSFQFNLKIRASWKLSALGLRKNTLLGSEANITIWTNPAVKDNVFVGFIKIFNDKDVFISYLKFKVIFFSVTIPCLMIMHVMKTNMIKSKISTRKIET